MATIEVHARIASPINWMAHQPRKPSEKIVTTSHGRVVQMLARATIAATTGGQMPYSWKRAEMSSSIHREDEIEPRIPRARQETRMIGMVIPSEPLMAKKTTAAMPMNTTNIKVTIRLPGFPVFG